MIRALQVIAKRLLKNQHDACYYARDLLLEDVKTLTEDNERLKQDKQLALAKLAYTIQTGVLSERITRASAVVKALSGFIPDVSSGVVTVDIATTATSATALKSIIETNYLPRLHEQLSNLRNPYTQSGEENELIGRD